MKSRRLVTAFLSAALLVAALPLAAARRTDDALALVPADAAAVGVVRVADLRTSPLFARLFDSTDGLVTEGDAARFLSEARLSPKEDVDLMIVAGGPKGERDGHGLVVFEGRFDPARIAAALASRGAEPRSTPNGDYVLLRERHGNDGTRGHSSGALAVLGPRLVVAGDEASVVRALADRAAGGSAFLSGGGLGQKLARVDTNASVWALVDMEKMPRAHRASGDGLTIDGTVDGKKVKGEVRTGDGASDALFSVMRGVSLFAFHATVKGDAISMSASGLSSSEETRELLEDGLRGVTAAWRLAVQDKAPEMVAVIRRFKVSRDDDGVTISGTIPGAAVRAFAEKTRERSGRAAEGD